jgi:ssDNA-binding Zn-finger/Zn-ribbon topoisomerase 1
MSAPLHSMRCPRCGDHLKLYHTAQQGRSRHFLGCLSYPRCSYTADYDEVVHTLLLTLDQRLERAEAHIIWLTGQLEALFIQRTDAAPIDAGSLAERRRALTTWADVAHRFQ